MTSTSREDNLREYRARLARHRAGEGTAALYAELLILARRLDDPIAQEVWAQEMRRASDRRAR